MMSGRGGRREYQRAVLRGLMHRQEEVVVTTTEPYKHRGRITHVGMNFFDVDGRPIPYDALRVVVSIEET